MGFFINALSHGVLMRLLQDIKVERARLYSSALRDAGLDSQIRWLQESFDTAQTSASI